MKLIRWGPKGDEHPGVELPDGNRVDVRGLVSDFNRSFFENNGLSELRSKVKKNKGSLPDVPDEERLGPPVANPSKIICIGLNYAEHAEESDSELPDQPVLFTKATTALTGPNDDVVMPRGSEKTDWEVELAVAIGATASYVSEGEAMNYVAGFMLHNDYSERTFQLEQEGQWVKGKSADTFAPMGPYLVTKEDIDDPHNLDLWLDVNGERRQESNTSNFLFDIPHLVHYISQYMTLLPGDVISTGTPPGVGLGMDPPSYLEPGDEVELGIEELGSAKQKIVPYEEDQHHAY